MSILNDNENEEVASGGGAGKWIAAVAFIAIVGGGVAFWMTQQRVEPPAPEPAPVESEPAAEAPPPPPKKKAPSRRADVPSTGTISVSASVSGAQVYIDGELAGETPYEDAAIPIGQYAVTVKKDGYIDFNEDVRVRPGQAVSLRASLDLVPPSLNVTSDVAGATVFVNRKYVGETPVLVPDLTPGEHQITVSAEGYDMHAETVTIGTGRHELQVAFQSQVEAFQEAIAVVHKHSFGKCEGRLVADAQGIRFETDHKDAFAIPYDQLERFEVDYIKKNLNLKIARGKNYNFTEETGNSDPLFVFHKNVSDHIQGP